MDGRGVPLEFMILFFAIALSVVAFHLCMTFIVIPSLYSGVNMSPASQAIFNNTMLTKIP